MAAVFGFGLTAAVLLALCVGALLWMAKASGGPVFMQDVIRMQFMGRMDGSEGVSGSLYYFTSSMGNYALAYPLALLALLGLALNKPRDTGPAVRLLQYCAAAGLIVMLGLSIPQAKKARYLLPILPFVAIIAAYPFGGPGSGVRLATRLDARFVAADAGVVYRRTAGGSATV
jgi:hypothetical protein